MFWRTPSAQKTLQEHRGDNVTADGVFVHPKMQVVSLKIAREELNKAIEIIERTKLDEVSSAFAWGLFVMDTLLNKPCSAARGRALHRLNNGLQCIDELCALFAG